jgi:hypothetical protein
VVPRVVAAEGARNLFLERLLLAKLLQQRLVLQPLDVAGVVERRRLGRRLVHLAPVARLARVDALPDTEPAEVGERDLELADGLVARDKVLGRAGLALFLDLRHGGWVERG